MSSTQKSSIIFIILLVIVGAVIWFSARTPVKTGSISNDEAYTSTSTHLGWTLGQAGWRVLKTGPGILGSVVINLGAATAGIELWDATTTTHATTSGYYSTTTGPITVFKTTATAGTYTFDRAFSKGLLMIETGVAVSSSTITWK